MTTMPTLNEWIDAHNKPRRRVLNTCADCQKPCRGYRCAQHAAAARIGKPRGTATGDPKKRPKEPSLRELYPIPRPSLDTTPLTLRELAQAKCHDKDGDPDICFPETNAIAEAKALCHGCPIAQRCLAVAIKNREPHGLWGGATPQERDKIRRKDPKRWDNETGKTHCKNGHKYTVDSAYTIKGVRRCRRCQADANARYKASKNLPDGGAL